MENKTIEKLYNNLEYYKKELEEYHNGIYDSVVRDLEKTIEETEKEIEKRTKKRIYTPFIGDEIIHGTPLYIEMELKREIIKQIQDLGTNNYEDITTNMINIADIFNILEENINEEFILLKYNPMGAWYKNEDQLEIDYYRDSDIAF